MTVSTGLHCCLFLDRDGVIIEDIPYSKDLSKIVLLKGIVPIIGWARDRGYLVVVATNQAGIARGYYTVDDYLAMNDHIAKLLAKEGSYIDRWYHCPYHPSEGIGPYRLESELRKPAPGMFLEAAHELSIALDKSIMIGDKITDIINYPGIKTFLIRGRYDLSGVVEQEIIFSDHHQLLVYLQNSFE